MNHHTQEAPEVVAGNFQFQAQLPNGKGVSVSCYVFKDEDEKSLNARLDLVARVVERQRAIAEIPELETKLEQMKDARRQVEAILEDLGSKSKLSSQEQNTLNTQRQNIKRLDAEVIKGEQTIANARAKLRVEA